MISLENKRILITGASSGIGKQLALELAKYKTKLVLVSRNEKKMKEVSREIKKMDPEIYDPIIIACDVTKNDEIQNAVTITINSLHGIDILINNAGIGVYGPVFNTPIEDYRNVMDVNFFGAVNFTLQVLPEMKKCGNGTVVFVSSVASLYGIPCYSAYCASKAALKSFSQTLRSENENSGISVLHVAPDYTRTRFFRNEKFNEGARLKRDKMANVEVVAKKIIGDIITQKKETVLSLRGKILRITNPLLPRFIEAYFKRRASKLILKK